MTTSVLLQLGHIKGLFMSCGTAVTARVGAVCVCACAHACVWCVRVHACVGV
jgi:hypothetical protein